jgi:hypothetical protein
LKKTIGEEVYVGIDDRRQVGREGWPFRVINGRKRLVKRSRFGLRMWFHKYEKILTGSGREGVLGWRSVSLEERRATARPEAKHRFVFGLQPPTSRHAAA